MNLLDLIIPDAHAQAAGGGGGLDFFIPMIAIFAIFYFLLIRPQQKRAREHKEMLANVQRGDNIITTGGIKAKVQKVSDDELIVEVPGGTQLTIIRDGVAHIVDKTLPAKPKAKAGDAEEEKPKGLFGGLLGGGKK